MIELKNLEVKVSLYYRNNQAYGNTDCWVFMRGIQSLKNFWIKSTYSKDIIQFYELVLWGGVKQCQNFKVNFYVINHGLRTPGEEIAFTAQLKIKSQSQIFRYGQSIFCLPHWPKFSDFFDLCLHWVSVVRATIYWIGLQYNIHLLLLGGCKTMSIFDRELPPQRSKE